MAATNQLISTADTANGCNKTTLTLVGSGDTLDALIRSMAANDWSSADVDLLESYTDGYKIAID